MVAASGAAKQRIDPRPQQPKVLKHIKKQQKLSSEKYWQFETISGMVTIISINLHGKTLLRNNYMDISKNSLKYFENGFKWNLKLHQ